MLIISRTTENNRNEPLLLPLFATRTTKHYHSYHRLEASPTSKIATKSDLNRLESPNLSKATESLHLSVNDRKRRTPQALIRFSKKIDLSITTGIKTFNNASIGLDDEERYDGIQDSITKHF